MACLRDATISLVLLIRIIESVYYFLLLKVTTTTIWNAINDKIIIKDKVTTVIITYILYNIIVYIMAQ